MSRSLAVRPPDGPVLFHTNVFSDKAPWAQSAGTALRRIGRTALQPGAAQRRRRLGGDGLGEGPARCQRVAGLGARVGRRLPRRCPRADAGAVWRSGPGRGGRGTPTARPATPPASAGSLTRPMRSHDVPMRSRCCTGSALLERFCSLIRPCAAALQRWRERAQPGRTTWPAGRAAVRIRAAADVGQRRGRVAALATIPAARGSGRGRRREDRGAARPGGCLDGRPG